VQNDVTYLAIILGLFAVMLALVVVCDRIIGPDEASLEAEGSAAPAPVARSGSDGPAVAA
jgi:hypothetical protein